MRPAETLVRGTAVLLLLITSSSLASCPAVRGLSGDLPDAGAEARIEEALAKVRRGALGAGFRMRDRPAQREMDRALTEADEAWVAMKRHESAETRDEAALARARTEWSRRAHEVDRLAGAPGAYQRLIEAKRAVARRYLDRVKALSGFRPVGESAAPQYPRYEPPYAGSALGGWRRSRTVSEPRAYSSEQAAGARAAVYEAFEAALRRKIRPSGFALAEALRDSIGGAWLADSRDSLGEHELYERLSAHLEAEGVAHRIVWSGHQRHYRVEILPQEHGPSVLNRMAFQLGEKHGTTLTFDAMKLMAHGSNVTASFLPGWRKGGTLQLPWEAMLEPALGSISVDHEILHSAKTRAVRDGEPYVFAGRVSSVGEGELPGRHPEASKTYARSFAFDELDAYALTVEAHLAVRRSLGPLLERYLVDDELRSLPVMMHEEEALGAARTGYHLATQTERLGEAALRALQRGEASVQYQQSWQMRATQARLVMEVDGKRVRIVLPLPKSRGATDRENGSHLRDGLSRLRDGAAEHRAWFLALIRELNETEYRGLEASGASAGGP